MSGPRFPHRAAFSFDIEDWHHSEVNPVPAESRGRESIVRRGTEQILDLLRRHRLRCTFFVLGAVVREHPDLVRRMVDEGHELACHGMNHRPVWRATPESFRDELREFRQVVTDALGEFPVIGFRAPTFSIDRSNPWALDVLRAEGYRYDSSIFPMKVKMYGTPGAPCWIYRPSPTDLTKHDPHADLVEFPVATAQVYRVRFPLGGGFYLRALPLPVFRAGLDYILRRRPFVLYLHPREVSPEAERMPLDPLNGFITYVNLHSVVEKLEHLFGRYEWAPMREILVEESWLGPPGTPRA